MVPPPPMPPPPPQSPDTVHAINLMWRHGKPSNSVAEAGVIVRVLDGLSKGVVAWEPCPADKWCDKYSAIWPSSLINARHNRAMYAGQFMGFVVAPPPVNAFFCIYPIDGNSMGHTSRTANGCQRSCGEGRTFDCSFPPEQLQQALDVNKHTTKYNEVVIDAQRMKAQLPRSLLGVFYVVGEASRGDAAGLAAAFRAAYGLGKESFPLMAFSPEEGFQRQA